MVLNRLVTVSASLVAIKFTHSVKSFGCNKLVSNQGGNNLFGVNHHVDVDASGYSPDPNLSCDFEDSGVLLAPHLHNRKIHHPCLSSPNIT